MGLGQMPGMVWSSSGTFFPWLPGRGLTLPPGSSFLSESLGRSALRSLGIARRAVLGASVPRGPWRKLAEVMAQWNQVPLA